MMQLIVKSYFSVLFAVSASCLAIFLLGIFFIFKKSGRDSAQASEHVSDDIHAIAGEDPFSTQLDLARAFMESGKEQFARKILKEILQDGNRDQQQEARVLLAQL